MDPLTTMALVKAGSSLANYAFNRWGKKQPAFDDTEYGRNLRDQMNRGVYNQTVRSNILGLVGKVTGNAAQTAKADLKGNLIASGMENSIAGQGQLAAIDRQRIDKLGDTSTELENKNELSKEQAKQTYAQTKSEYQGKVRTAHQANTQNLVGGLLDAAGGYVTGKMQQSSMKNLDFSNPESLTQWVATQPDQGNAIGQLRDLAYSSYYGGRGAGAIGEQDILSMIQKNPEKAPQMIQVLNELGMLPERILNYLKAGE